MNDDARDTSKKKWYCSPAVLRVGMHAMLILVMILAMWIGICRFTIYARSCIHDWTYHDSSYTYKEFKADTLQFAASLGNYTECERKRLSQQYIDIQSRAKVHLNVVLYYYMRYYMAISMATIAGVIAAIALLFITRAGWSKTCEYIITIFLFTSSAALYFTLFPTLFEQKKNIDENISLFISYEYLENRILTYAATGHDTSADTAVNINKFIITIDKEMKNLHRFPIEFDPGAIPHPKKIIQDIMPGG